VATHRPEDLHERRRRAEARRGSQQKLAVAVIAALGIAVALAIVLTNKGRNGASRTDSTARRAIPRLAPPGPIPGYLLIADRGNNRMLLVDSRKRIYWSYPGGRRAAIPFRFDDDTFFGPKADRIISNQEDQHTIQVISFPRGRLLWRYGHVNRKGAAPGYLNTPDDAYLLPNGLTTVADAYNCRVLFISRSHHVVRQFGTAGVCRHDPPRALGAVNGATPLPDGGVLISEINGSWIDDVSRAGRLRWSAQAPVSYPSDPQLLSPNRILLADYARPGHALVMTRTGRVLWRYGPASGPGELDHPSLATRIAPNLIAINDDYRDRVVLINMKTHKIVWQYGHTGVRGRRPGYLNTPDGLDLLRTSAANTQPLVHRMLAAASRHRTTHRATSGLVRTAPFRLPAPVQREVAVAVGPAIVIAGGLDGSGQSTNGVFRLDPANGRLTRLGTVPQPFHDAAGALIGNRLFVFGGGSAISSSAVQSFDLRTARGGVVGRLPRAISDLAAVSVGSATYLVGGFDGVRPRAEIYRTTDGRHFALVGRLPIGVRYPAVAAAGSTLVVAGGVTPSGTSSSVYTFTLPNGPARRLGLLTRPTAHAVATALGTTAYVVGGVDSSGRTVGAATGIDLRTARITRFAATAPFSDAAGAVVAGRWFLIAGERAGRALTTVREARLP
jgi:hypothetical protein